MFRNQNSEFTSQVVSEIKQLQQIDNTVHLMFIQCSNKESCLSFIKKTATNLWLGNKTNKKKGSNFQKSFFFTVNTLTCIYITPAEQCTVTIWVIIVKQFKMFAVAALKTDQETDAFSSVPFKCVLFLWQKLISVVNLNSQRWPNVHF